MQSIGNLKVSDRNGMIYLSDSSRERFAVAGANPSLSQAAGLKLWWLSGRTLMSADVSGLEISGTSVVNTNIDSYVVRDLQGIGVAIATVSDTNLQVQIGSNLYAGSWPAERTSDFDFDFSDDLQKMYVVFRKPGSPIQAFVEEYETRGQIQMEIVKVYDFSLGPTDLPSTLVPFFK